MALLEREAELAAVDRGLARLCDGGAGGARPAHTARPGTPLAFTGAAGLGKTALLRETAARAAARGCTVVHATAGEQEQEVGLHLLRALLEPLLPVLDEHRIRTALGRTYHLAARAAGLPAPCRAVAPHPGQVRRALDGLLAHAAEHLAARGAPLVLLIDDAHWADPASLAWLTGFLPRAAELPLLCALAYDTGRPRPDTAGPHTALDSGAATSYALQALSAQAVETLVRDTLCGPDDASFTKECWVLTGGVPLAVTELLARARRTGLAPHRDSLSRLPGLARTLHGTGFLDHLESLGTACVRLSWAVAVLGADATLPLAARVAGLTGAAAHDAADTLRRERVLGASPHFTHPSLAGEVYRAVPASLRTALHGQAAATLAAAGPGAGTSARHLLEIHPDADPDVVDRLRRAAHAYAVAGAPETAYRFLGRALSEPPARCDRPAVLYELASAALRSGAPAAAVHPLRAALAEPDCAPALRSRVTRLLARATAGS
ncbi:AAA family ATPase [Streptomyces albus subsp. chlorinus]|uniref:AAA family ATPase n=1 Tax=Streptomyces albus TaxID=1888 RepID=UPI001570A1E0